MATLSFQGQGTIITGTVTCDLASVLTGAVTEKSLTITGAKVGDICVLAPPAAGVTAGLAVCGAVVSAADTVKLRVANLSGGTIDEASGTWSYILIRA